MSPHLGLPRGERPNKQTTKKTSWGFAPEICLPHLPTSPRRHHPGPSNKEVWRTHPKNTKQHTVKTSTSTACESAANEKKGAFQSQESIRTSTSIDPQNPHMSSAKPLQYSHMVCKPHSPRLFLCCFKYEHKAFPLLLQTRTYQRQNLC